MATSHAGESTGSPRPAERSEYRPPAEPHLFETVEAFTTALRRWWRDGAVESEASQPEVARFEALFSHETECIHDILEGYDIPIETLASAYFRVVDADCRMVNRSDLREDLCGGDYDRVVVLGNALCEIADIFLTRGGDYGFWLVQASPVIAERLAMRRLSLQKYRVMEPVLSEFREECCEYFERRRQPYREGSGLIDCKHEYARELQERYFPDSPIDEADKIGNHPCSRYIRTAQDEVMLTYAFDGENGYDFIDPKQAEAGMAPSSTADAREDDA